MTEKTYFQCDLSQGTRRTHGYIEARGARIGARVEIDGEFWTVDSVASQGMSEERMKAEQRMHRNAFASIAP